NHKLAGLISDESFVRWIKGTASIQEQKQWTSWEAKDSNHRDLKKEAEMFFQMPLELDAANDLEIQLANLNDRIDRAEQEMGRSANVKKMPKRNMGGYRIAVAATIILLLSAIGVLYLYYPADSSKENRESLYTSVEAGYGETSLLKFSDGSR